MNTELKEKFTEIYFNNGFKGVESISGIGSGLEQTKIVRENIPKIIKRFNIKRTVDASCGDLFWIKQLINDGVFDEYIGVDIVKEMIDNNIKNNKFENISFKELDIVSDIVPTCDLIICRDCLVHLSLYDALKAILKFKQSNSTYLLTTTFARKESNEDLGNNLWRTLNLRLHPFYFPMPILTINEGCTEGKGFYADKEIALWELSDINFSELLKNNPQ